MIGEIIGVEEVEIIKIMSRIINFKEEDIGEATEEDIGEDLTRNRMIGTIMIEVTIIITETEVRIIFIREAQVIKMNIEEEEVGHIIKIVNMKNIMIKKRRKNILIL